MAGSSHENRTRESRRPAQAGSNLFSVSHSEGIAEDCLQDEKVEIKVNRERDPKRSDTDNAEN